MRSLIESARLSVGTLRLTSRRPLTQALTPSEPKTVTLEGELLAPDSAFRSPHAALLRTSLEDALGDFLATRRWFGGRGFRGLTGFQSIQAARRDCPSA